MNAEVMNDPRYDQDYHLICDEQVPFYERGYYFKVREGPKTDELRSPKAIYSYLISRTYGQEQAAKRLAILLGKHMNGKQSNMLIIGDSGTGKTHLIKTAKEIYPYIKIVDSSGLTRSGYVGGSVTDCLRDIDPAEASKYIICFDEADKIFANNHSNQDDIGLQIQGEFLAMLTGEDIPIKEKGDNIRMINTEGMSFIFMGAWGRIRESINESRKTYTIGFNVDHETGSQEEITNELTIEELLTKANISNELLGRIDDVVCLNRLSEEEFFQIICDHDNSVKNQLEEKYQIKLDLADEYCHKLAKEAYESKLGVRYLLNSISRRIDDKLWENDTQKQISLC